MSTADLYDFSTSGEGRERERSEGGEGGREGEGEAVFMFKGWNPTGCEYACYMNT